MPKPPLVPAGANESDLYGVAPRFMSPAAMMTTEAPAPERIGNVLVLDPMLMAGWLPVAAVPTDMLPGPTTATEPPLKPLPADEVLIVPVTILPPGPLLTTITSPP